MLDPTMLAEGENSLEAWWTAADGRESGSSRRFALVPGGRTITVSLVRKQGGKKDRRASGRLIVIPLDGAPSVDFAGRPEMDLPGQFVETKRNWLLVRGGQAEFYLPEGRYRIIASGGPFHELDSWEPPATGSARHRFRLNPAFRLPPHAVVDFHVHAAASSDSMVPMTERVWSFLAAGVNVMVASDHGDIIDYRPLIASLPAARGRLQALPGVETGLLVAEFRGDHMGHWNIWPLAPAGETAAGRPTGRSFRHGALEKLPPAPDGMHAAHLFEAYREHARQLAEAAGLADDDPAADPIIQLNHPRGIDFHPSAPAVKRVHDWFNRTGFDPGVSLSQPEHALLVGATPSGTRGLDFDALEVWNRASRRLYLEVRADWFALLSQGWRPTGTANTDTHTLEPEIAGYPVNIVLLQQRTATGPRVPVADLVEAVRSGRVIGSDGPVPLLTATAGWRKAGPGELLTAADGRVRVRVDVRAASWVPRRGVRLWANGRVVAERDDGARRIQADLDLTRDTWILAEAGRPDDGLDGMPLPGLYGTVAPRGMAVGFTNPVFIDVDGNGRFDPPGLDARSPEGPR